MERIRTMTGQTDIKEQEFIPVAKVGEIESSFGGKAIDIVDSNAPDIEAEINSIARRSCEPDKQIYDNNSNLCDNPLEAVKHVKITGFIPKNEYPEKAVIAQIAKLQVAEDNLKITPKQKEVFEGYKENQKGGWGYFSSITSAIKNPEVRHKVICGSLATLETIGLAGCVAKGVPAATEVITPTQSPIVETAEVTSIPGFIPKETVSVGGQITTETPAPGSTNTSDPSPVGSTETATATVEATKAPVIEVAPYPSSIKEFESGPSVLTGVEAEERIKALGAGEDLQVLKDWYTSVGVPASMLKAVIGESDIGAHWNVVLEYPNGKHAVITLTSGAEEGKIVRDGGLVSYLYNDPRPNFTYRELVNPEGFESVPQKWRMSESFWFASTLEGNVGWANLDIGQKEEWVDLQTLATPTPEGPMGTFASLENVTSDSEGYHITLETGREVDATKEQIEYDEEFGLWKVYDAEGNITAENDPGQGKEGEENYVPATGWVDIKELSEKISCRGPNATCIYDNNYKPYDGGSILIDFKTTGVFRYRDVKNTLTDEKIGKILVLEIITRNKIQATTSAWILVQAEKTNHLGINEFRMLAQSHFIDLGLGLNGDGGKSYPIDQWEEWFNKNTRSMSLSFDKSGRSYSDFVINKTVTTSEVKALDFITNYGVGAPQNTILCSDGSISSNDQT